MVATKGVSYPDKELYEYVLTELEKRNITQYTVGEAAHILQHKYFPNVSVEEFGAELPKILKKREVLNILATGFALDNLATEQKLPQPLQFIVENDLGIFGVDETLAMAISQLYGSIAQTNYGFADKEKMGLAKKLDNSGSQVNTFADDLFLALVSGVVGRFGHGSALKL